MVKVVIGRQVLGFDSGSDGYYPDNGRMRKPYHLSGNSSIAFQLYNHIVRNTPGINAAAAVVQVGAG